MSELTFDILKNKTIVKILGLYEGSEVVKFICSDGEVYCLYHEQSCCETVSVNEIIGDVDDILNTPILRAEVVSNVDYPPPCNVDSYTWTFYKLDTIKGSIVLRWLGESNGYYSEEVSFCKE